MHQVVARVELPVDQPVPRAVALRVTIEDVTRADASSVVVAERTITDVPLDAVTALEVPVGVPEVLDGHRYICRVHVDVDGSGTVATGDLLSTQSHPVLTDGAGTSVTVPLRRV